MRVIFMKIIATMALLTLSGVSIDKVSSDTDLLESEEINQNSFTSLDKTAVLTVPLERFKRESIRHIDKGSEIEAWSGERKLPSDILWRESTMISSFSLKIDGKKINISKRFWNDLVGLDLRFNHQMDYQ